MKRIHAISTLLVASLCTPLLALCQAGPRLEEFHKVLEGVKKEMIPMASDLLIVAQTIAAFGALWYIGVRVWKHLAAAEAIDFFPLFRPFCIAILITIYPSLLGLMDGVLEPTSLATKEMVKKNNKAVDVLLEQRLYALATSGEPQDLAGNIDQTPQNWQKYEQQEEDEGFSLGKALSFSMSIFSSTLGFIIKFFLSLILQLLYFAAAICIDALRMFNLVILSLLGPIVLCLSTYDGFQHLLPNWISRYINIYLWLPIANLFGAMIAKIQAGMLRVDITEIGNGNIGGFGQTDIAYMIFLVVGIVGYFSIPSIANYVIQVSGGNAIVSKTNTLVMMAGKAMV